MALAVLEKLLDQGMIGKADKVRVISSAHGLKFPDFKSRYHSDGLGDLEVVPRYRNDLREVAADYDKVRDLVLDELDNE